MKKLLSLVLSLLLALLPLAPAASAAEDNTVKEYYEDGSYIMIGSFELNPEGAESSASIIARIISMIKQLLIRLFGKENNGPKTVTRMKDLHYYDKNGIMLWTFTLTAEFTYDGKTSVCNSTYVRHEIFDRDWKILFTDHGKNGATAWGKVELQQYKLGVPLKNYEKTLTITCDKNGNIT